MYSVILYTGYVDFYNTNKTFYTYLSQTHNMK